MNRTPLHGRAGAWVEDPTDADYAAAARDALRAGDLRLAMEQVSAALALRPLHAPHLGLLDRVIAAAKGPLLLVELPPEGAFFGLCAARARVLAKLGRLDEAIEALFEAAAFRPSTPFVPWAKEWVKAAKSSRKIRPATLAAALIKLSDSARRAGVDGGARENLEAAIAIAEKVRAQHPPSPGLLAACSRALRALDRGDVALSMLATDEGANPGAPAWEIAVERAALHGERGEGGERIAWLERAHEARPDDLSTCLDLGDAHLDDGELDRAAGAYDRALAIDAASEWATISAAYVRALRGDAAAGPLFQGDLRDAAARERARSLEADLAAYVSRLADPTDALVGVIRGAGARAIETARGARFRARVRADRPPAPSARVAFAIAIADREGELVVEHDGGAPRVGPLWRTSAEAEPAVPRPPDEVIDRVAEIARTPFDWASWCARAIELSASLGEGVAGAIADAMAHVPRPAEVIDASRWVHGFQIAAALLIALRDAPASSRMDRLEALLAGTDDWSAAAAVLGLRALAAAEPNVRTEIAARLHGLLPADDEPLPALARALAIAGSEIAEGDAQRDFLRLRARVRSEIDEPRR